MKSLLLASVLLSSTSAFGSMLHCGSGASIMVSAKVEAGQSVPVFTVTTSDFNASFTNNTFTPSDINSPLGGFSIFGDSADHLTGAILTLHPTDESRMERLTGFLTTLSQSAGVVTHPISCVSIEH